MTRIKKAIIKGFNRLYDGKVKRGRLLRTERVVVRVLYEEKYSTEEWILKGDVL